MTGRNSVKVRAARVIQRLPLSWLRAVEAPLVHAKARGAGTPRMIILLALPRSGSTLTYQSLIHSIQPLYLSNLWNLLYALPWSGGKLCARLCADYDSDFHSSHGFVEGMCGPAEGLRFWSYWTGCGLDESQEKPGSPAINERRVAYLRNVFSSLTTPDRPFLSGYLGHVLIADRLREWFPEAVFLRLRRDPLSNAMSILRCRQKQGGRWFSVFPRECESLQGADLHTQVAGQVYWLNRRLDALNDDERLVDIGYEKLCRSPDAEVRRIADCFNSLGLELNVKRMLPDRFDYKVTDPEESDDAARLASALRQMEEQHGVLGQKNC